MKNMIALFSLFLCSTSAHALELRLLQSSNEADANFCGDINSAAVYEITALNPEERDPYLPDHFVFTTQGLEKIRSVLALGNRQTQRLVVTASYENAKNQLERALGPVENETLESCQPKSVLEWFGLESGQKVALGSYYVLGELSQNGVWADEFRHHVVIDLKRMRLATFIIW